MKIIIISPSVNLIDLLAEQLAGAGQDLSDRWVVFPEKRPGHYLRKSLAQRLKKSFLPPLVSSFDDFIDFLFTELLHFQAPLLDQMEAIGLLYQLHRDHPEPAGGRAFLNLDEFFPLGLKLYQDLEELKTALVTKDKFLMIDSLVSESIPPQTRNRFQKLSYFYQKFYSRLERENLSTRASRLEKVLENLSPDHFNNWGRIILAGFFLQARGEIELIKLVLGSEKAQLYLINGPGLEAMIKQLGRSESEIERLEPDSTPSPQTEFYLSPDGHGQLFLLNTLIADKVKNPELLTEKQVIVLPAAETLIPLHQQTLSALPDGSYNISLGYPLTRTPLFSFFDSLFNLIQTADEEGRFYAPDYLNFILHPYTKNIYFPTQPRRAELTRILFHLVQSVLTEKKVKLFWSLEEIENDPELNRRLSRYAAENPEVPEATQLLSHLTSIHHRIIKPLLNLKDIRDFGTKLSDLLEFLASETTAAFHLFFQPYAETFLRTLDRLRNSLLASLSFENVSGYFNLFRKLVAEVRVPFPGTPLHGLQVLGFWETRCLNFNQVFLLDMNEDIIPATGRVDSLLPYPLRKALGLLTHEDQEKRTEYYLQTLTAGAKQVYFFFVENSEKEKSRYVEKFLWEKQKKDHEKKKPPDSFSYIRSLSYRIALKSPEISPIPKTKSVRRLLEGLEISASKLDTYLSCPLKFYYSAVLKLEEREEISETMEKAEIGILVHEVLKSYFEPFLGKKLPPELDTERLDNLIEAIFETRFSQPLTGSFFLMKEQMKNHLRDFISLYQQPLAASLNHFKHSLKLLALEKRFQIDYQLGHRTFHLAGILDRIEKRGKYCCILDYKIAANEKYYQINFDRLNLNDRATWPEAIRSLQLPFYQLLASSELPFLGEEIYSAVLLLGQNQIDENIEFSPLLQKKARDKSRRLSEGHKADIFPLNQTSEDLASRKEKFQLAKEIIQRLLLEIVDPGLPFSPELARKDSCLRCPYQNFCGQ